MVIKMSLRMATCFTSCALCFLAVLLSGISLEAGEHDTLENLAGPPFTAPSEIMEMPDAWVKRPIKYDASFGDVDLVVTLDQHLYPALLPSVKSYANEHKLKIVVKEGTCGITAGMLSRKSADIGGYCCPPGITDRLPGLRFHTLGISALALLVHPDNPVDTITLKQARQIFTGEIYRWSELKTSEGNEGPNLPVHPVGRLHCKLRPGHWRLLLDNQDIFSTSLMEVGAIPDMISKVAANPGAIGYEVLWNLTRYKEYGRVRALKVGGNNPYSQERLISNDYPLYRVYNLSTWEGEKVSKPQAQKLVRYLLKQSEQLGKKHFIIPASRLRNAGWKFNGNELVGEPK